MNYLNPADPSILGTRIADLPDCYTCEGEGAFAGVECPTCAGTGDGDISELPEDTRVCTIFVRLACG